MAARPLPLLPQVRIASPCPMAWDAMEPTGDPAVRHCSACRLQVHDLSAMTAERAEELLRAAGRSERLCIAFYQREDGTILTRDCPVGLRAARQHAARIARRIAAAVGLALTGGALFGAHRADGRAEAAGLRSIEPFATVSRWLAPEPPAYQRMVGMRCPPTQQSSGISVK